MSKMHLLDRRWAQIEFGALADCGMAVNINQLTTNRNKVTCGGCRRTSSFADSDVRRFPHLEWVEDWRYYAGGYWRQSDDLYDRRFNA